MKKIQGSSILIVVMVLMIMSIVVSAILKLNITAMHLATDIQIKKQMQVDNEYALLNVFSRNSDLTLQKSILGVFGFTKGKSNREVIWCLTAHTSTQSAFFISTKTSLMQWTTGNTPTSSGGTTGFCKASDGYKNAKQNTMTQIAVYNDTSKTASSVSDGALTTGDVYVATATTFMPQLSTAADSAINSCLSSKMNNLSYVPSTVGTTATRVTVGQCLKALGVPAYTTTAMYVIN